MKKEIGLWIDHRKAVIVIIREGGEEVREIISHMEKHVRFAGRGSEHGSDEDMRDRQYEGHLNDYYDQVIAAIRDGDSIQIFGPGEAKGELETRLESEGRKGHILAIESADKMTVRQIAARVRRRFRTQRARQSR